MHSARTGAPWWAACILIGAQATAVTGAQAQPSPDAGVGQGDVADAAGAGEAPDGGMPGGDPAGEGAEPGAPEGEPAEDRTDAPVGAEDAPAQTEPAGSTESGITGRVVDASTGEGIIEGKVEVVGGKSVRTDIDGNFSIDLPPRSYTLRSFYEFYEPGRVEGVVVRPGQRTEVTIELQPEAEEAFTEEVVVTARADTSTVATQLQIRRESAAVRDAVSAEEISKSGDSTASSAARRVVGITIEDDKYLVIRGLGGRWNQVMLNGVPVPNLDPDLPSVQLDVFPASLLSNLAVLKTFVPDNPGGFAGGQFFIGTEDFPDELRLELGVSLGFNTLTTFRDLYVYDGGGSDWLGFDDGTRALPGGVPGERVDTFPVDDLGLTREHIIAIAEDLNNEYTPTRRPGVPNLGFNFVLGDTATVGDRPLGYLLSFNYGYGEQRGKGVVRLPQRATTGKLEAQNDYDVTRSKRSVLWGVLGSVSYGLSDDDELSLVTMWNQSATDLVELQRGTFTTSDSGAIAQWTLDYVQRSMFLGQLRGKHSDLAVPPGSELTWTFFTNYGTRREPDRRTTRYLNPDLGADWTFDYSQNEAFAWQDKDFSGERFWSDLAHYDVGGRAELDIPIGDVKAKVGGWGSTTHRDFEARRFKLRIQNPDIDDTQSPEELFDAETFRPDGTGTSLEERTLPEDGYAARRNLLAAFALVQTPLGLEGLKLTAGVRAESFEQDITVKSPVRFPDLTDNGTFDYVKPSDTTERTNLNVLPSGSLVYEVVDDMFIRLGYGMTIVRPEVRELVPFRFFDFVRFREIIGNPDLVATKVHNVDVRWEWYPSPSEVIAVSGFYKKFNDPIEVRILDAENQNITYENSKGADNLGIELEGRVALGNLWDRLEHFTVGGNLALIHSKISLSDAQAELVTNQERPLQGQSPYVANLWLDFTHPDARVTVFLVYNVFGSRIAEVGTRVSGDPRPDVYQQPFHSLDLTAKWEPEEHLALKFKLQNLLFEEKEFHQGDFVRERIFEGMSASVGLEYTY